MGTVYDTDYIGTVKAWSGAVIPDNWMLADGRALDPVAYPELLAVVGTRYGGDGVTAFNLPDLMGRCIYAPNTPDLSDLGAAGGEASHVLSTAEMPYHAHGGATTGATSDYADTNHYHLINVTSGYVSSDHQHTDFAPVRGDIGYTPGSTWTAVTAWGGATGYTGGITANHSHNINSNTDWQSNSYNNSNHAHGVPALGIYAEGGGGAHNNLPPYLVLAFIIKVTGVQIDAGGALVGPPGPPGDSVKVPIEPWQYVGAPGQPAFMNGWANYMGGQVQASFRKMPDGQVQVRGLILGGSLNTTAFILPPGYRPQSRHIIVTGTEIAGTHSVTTVDSDGTVNPNYGTPNWISLNLMHFDTETVTEWSVGPKGDPGPRGVDGVAAPMPAAQAGLSAPQAFPVSVGTLIAFDVLQWVREAITLEGGCFRVPSGGVYDLSFSVLWDTGSAAGRVDGALINVTRTPPGSPSWGDPGYAQGGGVAMQKVTTGGDSYQSMSMSGRLECDAGDLIGVVVTPRVTPVSLYAQGTWSVMSVAKVSNDPPGSLTSDSVPS
jgi:microcystin-dependent protein